MYQYILYYVFVIESLQKQKILLMHNTSQKKSSHKMFVKKILLKTSTSQKLEFYECIQKEFTKTLFLVHHDSEKVLYMNMNTSKRRDFEMMIFYLKKN